ncbi:MAG: ATP-binding protein, partial [Betaproteobacteria bacterium]|nr:ATP-binding protein [Betaproteobacteria bacterium]
PEWDRRVLEVLREPLESGVIHISRAARQSQFPAQFQLIAAMNPCACGWLGHASGRCHCTPDRIARYRSRISGPLLDRIDLTVEVPSLSAEALAAPALTATRRVRDSGGGVALAEKPATLAAESSAAVRARVTVARACARDRQGKPNARLQPAEIASHCGLEAGGEALLAQAMARLWLSARSYHRVLKVARTIADLAGSVNIAVPHVAEAIGYRRFDRL